ncbi:hypothetical protein DPEC_G00297540 [Dallia pectoralis]|uniref:Uncharacterized protein n=1 Tax=Dallia pectoralis TaxID=75939 RepID=A0ACC2FFX0_DALPE|nr:hypothetical protein DPEC_G00297540 [Dallia pectoralis]
MVVLLGSQGEVKYTTRDQCSRVSLTYNYGNGSCETNVCSPTLDSDTDTCVLINALYYRKEWSIMNLSYNEENCSINTFKSSVYPPTYLTIFILGLVFNLTSLSFFVSVWRSKRGLSPVNLYMVNLLMSNLMLVCSLPFRASYYINDFNWAFGDVACRIMSYVFYINMYGSIYFLVVLSVVRYIAVAKPFRYNSMQSGHSSWLVCLLVWMLVSLASIPMLTSGTYVDTNNRTRCLELNPEYNSSNLRTLAMANHATMMLGFVIPFAVITVCYAFVVVHLLRRREGTMVSHKKSMYLVIIVLVLFLVCYMPYHIMRTVHLHAEGQIKDNKEHPCAYIELVRKGAVITLCLAAGNSCLDPLLYFFVGENLKVFCTGSNKQGAAKTLCMSEVDRKGPRGTLELQQLQAPNTPYQDS